MRPGALLATIVVALLLTPLPVALAHGRTQTSYVASAGVTYGEQGFSTNRFSGPGVFESDHSHYGVRITLDDKADLDPFIAICIDLTANGFCDDAEGDILAEGHSMVEVWAAEPFQQVIVFSDAIQYQPETMTLHASTQGTVRVDWLEGQQPPTIPPTRTPDVIESTLGTLLQLIFSILP